MSVEDLKLIDVISLDKEDQVVLTISDHLNWDLNNEHLLILQNKINSYLQTIESGELYTNYPLAKDRNIVFNVVAKYNPNREGLMFLKEMDQMLRDLGYRFQFSIYTNNDKIEHEFKS